MHWNQSSQCGIGWIRFRHDQSKDDGRVDLDPCEHLGSDTAVFMITNPSTLGLFDDQVQQISDMVHDQGGLIYLDVR